MLLLVPVLAMPGTLVLDNRLYLPACGVLLAVAEIVRAAAFERPEPAPPRLLVGALRRRACWCSVAITAGYEESFRDRRAFARAAVAGAPHSAARPLLPRARPTRPTATTDRALAEYETSLALGPGEVVHNNIAVIHMAHARWADAERELREELALEPEVRARLREPRDRPSPRGTLEERGRRAARERAARAARRVARLPVSVLSR